MKYPYDYCKNFITGRNQAISLSKEFRFEGKKVEIFRPGNEVILREELVTTDQLFKVLAQMPDDFYAETRLDEPPQE